MRTYLRNMLLRVVERMERKADNDCKEMCEQLCEFIEKEGKWVTLDELEQMKGEKV